MNKMESMDALLGRDDGHQACGLVCLANEARFTSAHFSEPLTAYAVGWRDPANLEAELDAVFPRVEVPRRFEFKAANNAQEFLSETDEVRAIGSSFKRLDFTGTSVNQKTLNKGLTIRMDRDEMMPGDEERAVGRLRARLLRNDLRRGYGLLVTAAAGANTAKTWDATAGKDPDQDVLVDLITGADARGIGSNLVVYGETAWQKRMLAHRAQNSAGGFASAQLTPEALAGLLGIDRVVVSKSRYQASASAKGKVIGGAYVLMLYAELAAGLDDPSNVKRFVTPTESGPVRVYRQEYDKYIDVSVEHYSNIVVTSTLGIRMFTVS